jgi:catechol 2,3-dioxygenase-like lactoylglutathione lyase family enzyme
VPLTQFFKRRAPVAHCGNPLPQGVPMQSRHFKTLALLIGALCALPAPAQVPPISGIAHIAFRAGNLDLERAFFRKLGYEESFVLAGNGTPSEVFVKINDRQFIELYPLAGPSDTPGWMHVCYESGDLSALQALYAARGLKPPPAAKAGAGNLLFSLHDPDSRVTEFTQYMPGSRHTLDRGKHLGAQRIATELMGFDLPAANLAADRQFFTAGLGFQARDTRGGVRLHLAGLPGLHIEIHAAGALHAAGAGNRLETLFRVPDAEAAARRLSQFGFTVQRQKRRASIADPDGNLFVFVEDRAR